MVVLVPVLGRPHRVTPVLESIAATAPGARVLFIPDPDDEPELAALEAAGAETLELAGGYAAKINAGVEATSEPLIFLGADDLDWQDGWLEAAMQPLGGPHHVVGVNDLIPRRPARRRHATHFLITRAYAQRPCADGTPGPMSTVYHHSFVDDELIATAKHRKAYVYAPEARVRHLHPMAHTAPDDETYQRGRERFRLDRTLFYQRQHLWT